MNLNQLQPNPNNPRYISEKDFENLKQKITRNPNGLKVHKIAYKNETIIAGNQRYRALKELKLKLSPEWFEDLSEWTDEQIREWLIVSNVNDGNWDWDALANEWDENELTDWGLTLVTPPDINFDDIKSTADREVSSKTKQVTCPYCKENFEA